MAESKKRWLALVMAVVMLTALLPDSFLSAVKVWAENNENTKNVVTIQFSAEENLNSDDFSLTLYELTNTDAEYEDKDKELTSTDGWYLLPLPIEKQEATDTDTAAQNTGRLKENKIVYAVTNEQKTLKYEFEGLSEDSQYVYEFCNSGNNYFTCSGIINMSNEQDLPQEITLNKIEAEKNKIKLSVNQNASAAAISVKYDICPVIKVKSDESEHVFRKQAEVQSSQGQVSTTKNDLEITFDNILYNSYEVDFYTEDNQISKKTVCIDYDSEKGAYKLADSEGDADSITFESNKADIFLQLDFSDSETPGGEINTEILGTAELYAYDESNDAYSETPLLQKTSVNFAEQVNLGTLDLPFGSKYMLKITISDKNSVYKTIQEFPSIVFEEGKLQSPVNGTGNRTYTLSGSEYRLKEKQVLSEENLLIKVEKIDENGNQTEIKYKNNQIDNNEIHFNDRLAISAIYKEGDEEKSYNILLELEYSDSENNWQKIEMKNGCYIIQKIAQHRITAKIEETDNTKGLSKVIEFSSNPLTANLEFNENNVEKDSTGTKNIVSIQAAAKDLNIPIDGNDYIKKTPEDAVLECSILNESVSELASKNVELKKDGNSYKLSIPAYFTGDIPIVYKLEKEGYTNVEKTVYFRVFYEEINKAGDIMLPDTKKVVYSNQENYRPIISSKNKYTFYAIKKENINDETNLTNTITELTDGIITLPDSTDGMAYYDIYAVNEQKNIYKSKLNLNIDTKSFEISIAYENGNIAKKDNINYYQGRKAKISFDKSKSEDSIDKESFQKNSQSLINSISYENIVISGSSLEISESADEEGWYQVTDKSSKDLVYKISEWNEKEKCYYLLFVKNGIYHLNNTTEFKDKYGNKATLVFSGDDQNTENDQINFGLDTTAPAADWNVLVRKYSEQDNAKFFRTVTVGKLNEFITTALSQSGKNIPITTSLQNIYDAVSGIKTIECAVTDSPIRELEEYKYWKSSDQNEEYEIKTVIDNNDKSKCSCTVTFTDNEISKKYYVYYKVVDNVGNTSYFNELGLTIDNKRPIIYDFEYDKTKTKEIDENKAITYFANTEVNVKFKIEDENLLTDKNGNITGITVKKNDAELTELSWKRDVDNRNMAVAEYSFKPSNTGIAEYKIEVSCEDKAGVPAIVHKETLIIDTTLSNIKNYEFYGTDDSLIEFVEEKKDENGIRESSIIGKNVNTDIKVKLQVEEDYFNKENIKIAVTKNSETKPIPISLGSSEWEKDNSNIYKNSITLNKIDNAETVYNITLECTDKAGNTSTHTEKLVVDKKSPTVTIRYYQNQDENNMYYYKREAEVSTDERISFNETDFLNAIKDAITPNESLDINYNKTNSSYTVKFNENAKYTIRKIEYTDKSGNTANETQFVPGTTHKTEFYVDTIAPIATAKIVRYKMGVINSIEEIITKGNENSGPFLSTFFGKSSQFILSDISDNLTGIKNVEYYLSKEPKTEDSLKGVVWCSSENKFQNTFFDEEVELKTENNGKQMLIVSLAEPKESSDYYIYYRITDKTKNVTIINGAGITLDQQDPEISFEYIKESENIKNVDILENTETIHAFSDNVNIKIIVTEEHFDKNNSSILVEKYSKQNNDINEYLEVLRKSGSDWKQDKDLLNQHISEIKLTEENLQTKKGEANQYKITVTAADDVGRISTRTEIVRIDREQPEITVEYDDSNKIQDHYYKGERTAKIIVKKTFPSSIDETKVLTGMTDIKTGIVVKDAKDEVINSKSKEFYKISKWDSTEHSYTVTYNEDAIYNFSLSFQDKLGNDSKEVVFKAKDGDSFVIDSNVPIITVSYTDNAKKADYYHSGKRMAGLEIDDLSFAYAYHYDKDTIILDKNKNEFLFNEKFINLSIDAKNPFVENQSSLLPAQKKWIYDGGKFKASISYEKEAVYTFKISGKDICGKEAVVNYKDKNGAINDGQSFVIDSTIPVITATYDDTNKKTGNYADGYYQGTRTSEIEIKDLSLYYAKTTNSPAHKDYPLTKEYVNWTIEAKDIQNADVEQAYQVYDFLEGNWTAYNDSTYYQIGWTYNESSCTFKGQISCNKDAVYTFGINGKDICQNIKAEETKTKTAQILYQSKKDGKIEPAKDGESFVIDTQAPIVIVTYDDNENNKLKNENGFIDHYYKDTRTATVTVSDLSFVYAYRKAGIKNPDAITGKPAADTEKDNEKINWAVSAKNEKMKDVQDAYSRPKKWTFSEETGIYTQEIQFTGEAIYEFALSGSDLCQNEASVEYFTTGGTNAKDGNSFVIDRTAPKVVITYDDTNKQPDTKGYYKGERTAEITITDLSYIYEEQQEKALGNKEPELTAARRIPIFISAKDSKSQEVFDAYVNGIWSFDSENGIYKKTITFSKDAIYTFEILKENDAEGVLKETTADIYGRYADIKYINKSGLTVDDCASFVISRENPKITVIYNDNEENKQEDSYYKDTRIAEIIVADLSYVYEDKVNQNPPDKLSVNSADKISLSIKAEDTKGIVEISDKISQEAWRFDSESGVYRKTINFDGDAIYTVELSGKNIFERNTEDADILYQNSSGEKITDGNSFVIDRVAPVITITYDNTNKKTDYYKNHFYAGMRTALIEISDLSYIYEDRQRAQQGNLVYITADRIKPDITAVNESGLPIENAYEQSGWNFNKTTGIYTNKITFQKNAIYSYSMQADDIYGNSIKGESEENNIIVAYQTQTADGMTAVTDWDSFVIDTEMPVVTVTYDDRNKGTNTAKPEYTNGYYKDNRTAHITVSDLSFIYADKYMPEHIDTNLVLNKTENDENAYILPNILAYSNDMEKNVDNAHTMNPESFWRWNESENGYQADITFIEEADYTFSITGEDICKNTANVSYSDVVDANRFVIDKTVPAISITYNDNTPVRTIDKRGYFSQTRTATVVITEGCDTFDRGDAFENIVITAKDAAGNDVGTDTYTVSSWTESKASANGNATKYTAEITYRGNANYTFAISYTDKTGHIASEINTNGSASPYTFTVDSAAPTGTVSVSGFGSWNRLAEILTFDRWSNSIVNITASAEDGISSVYNIKYYKTAATTAMTRQQLLDLNDSAWTDYSAFSVRPDEMFSVYLRVEDRSGNISFISSDGIIVDATAPNEESIAPEITVTPVQPVNNIYNTDVTVDIIVTDPIVNGSYSGLKNIRYEVQNMGAVTQQGQLYAFSYTAGQTLQSQLLQRWNGQIIVDRNLNNSNDVRIVVYAQDNSDNTSSAYTSVQIDVTQPSIDISYDNNSGDSSFGTETYFNADRTATISITERNFNADDVQITITNTDGVIPSVSGWSSFAGTGNGDDAVHTATITYSADGDYVFAISYADLAGNTNTAANYGNSLAPEQFTIDKTLPVINVAYDNNSVQNNNYYNAARTATISITEHNFDAGRYTITLAASDDGAEKTAPSIGGWSNNGDTHTASVQFTDDGYYSMNMSYTDMAGNQAAQFAQQTFYVDQTIPRIEVRGIQNNTANNKETIGFEITCTDTNFDVFTPQLSLTKMTDGKNVTENCEISQRKDIKNGQTYIVENLEQDGIYSLTCTARDKAGNIFDKVVYLNDAGQEASSIEASEGISFLNFSVNRRGSVYTLDSYTDEVAKEYYIRKVDENLVIVETNVDTLDSYIELNGKKLAEGTDYQTQISGGNGEWYVVRYIINKELFAGEGEYKVVIYSKDNAGNTAYSDFKGTNMSFIIDKTAPIVTVAGVENNGRYQVERQTVTVIPKDDGGKLQKITIEAFDQNGGMLDGFPIVYEGEELMTLLEENNGALSFELPEGTGMSVRITCEDAAGNEMDVMSFDNIVVSTNRLTIILADKRFIYGIIISALALTVIIILLIVWRKRKKMQGRENRKNENEE